MKRSIFSRFQLVLSAGLLLCTFLMLPFSAAAIGQTTNSFTGDSSDPVDGNAYFGRQALSSLPNATALLYAYDQLVSGIDQVSEKIAVYNGKDALTETELQTVIDAYRRDYTHHFWFGNTYSYEYDSETIHNLLPSYLMTGSALKTARDSFLHSADEILSGVSESMSDFDKELYLHDSLADRVVYVEGANAHNAYGAIVEGRAVCEGYAEALQYLLHRVGIRSFIALGSSLNPSTGATESHAWNYVQIDGQFYHVDLTWNDQGSELYHAYFNVTDARIREDHSIATAAYSLPSCTAEACFYFNVSGKLLGSEAYSVDSIAAFLKENGMRADIYVTGDPSELVSWFEEHTVEIATKMGIMGDFTRGCAVLGREVKLTIETSTCAHTAMTLIQARNASCTEAGNIAYYVCSCGKWFEDSEARTEITGKNSVRFAALGHSYTEITEDPDADTPRYRCTVCGERSDEGAVTPPPSDASPSTGTTPSEDHTGGCGAVISVTEALLVTIFTAPMAFLLKKRKA